MEDELVTLRRLLLELWAMFVLASIIGFMGPFGTYSEGGLADRLGSWWMLLMGAYVLVRPAIVLFRKLAMAIGLPRDMSVFWGVWLCSLPLAAIWRSVGQNEFRHLDDYTGLVPFSLLCSVAVLAVTRWAAVTDLRLTSHSGTAAVEASARSDGDAAASPAEDLAPHSDRPPLQPALANRLPPGFEGPILALQSEDHYVRVYGARDNSELLLMRLRDAIAEMQGVPGEQVHRSWWVAESAVSSVAASGRSWVIHLTSGQTAPVARDSIARLQRAGFLPRHPDDH